MARVTIERALEKISSKFELVVLAAHRAHALACGGRAAVKAADKYAVVAVREIESGLMSVDALRDAVLQKYILEEKAPITLNSFSSTEFAFDDLFASNTDNSEEQEDHLPAREGTSFKEADFDTSLFSSENE